jgi:hypothetical protein
MERRLGGVRFRGNADPKFQPVVICYAAVGPEPVITGRCDWAR